MFKSTLRCALTGLLLSVAAAAAHAAVWTPVPEIGGNFTIDYKGAPRTLHVEPSATLASPVYYYDANPGPQSPAAIQQELVDVFPQLTATSQITLAAACNRNASCAGTTNFSDAAGFHVTSTTAFDYLAVHLGGGELFFHWIQPVTSFLLSGLDVDNISNYRAYTSVSPVPVPGALSLFLSAIGVYAVARRRRKAAATSTPAAA